MQLLECLGNSDGPMGVVALAAEIGVAQATAHRLLKTLIQRGWVTQDEERRYALGIAVLRLGEPALRQVASTTAPFLREVVQVTGETSNLAVLEGDSVVYVAQVPSPQRLRTFAEVGHRVALHSTAVGKVLLAELPPDAAAARVERLELAPRTSRTITEPKRLLREIQIIRGQGFAVDDGEESDGVRCIAVPVRDGDGRCDFALSVSGPASRLPRSGAAAVAAKLRPIAERLGASTMPSTSGIPAILEPSGRGLDGTSRLKARSA